MTRAARYRLLAVLYGSQVIALTFFVYALPAVLRDQGASLRLIGLIQLLALAWVAKAAWAPLVDRYGSRRLGHYRGWLLALRVLTILAILALGPVPPDDELPLLVALVAVVVVLSATQDIAADATAVRLLAPSERGVGNGIQRAGSYFGYVVGAGGVLVVYDRLGWAAALAVMAALTAVPLPMLLRYREPEVVLAGSRPAASWRTVGSFFRQPGAARWALVVLPLYLVGVGTAYPLMTPMLVDAGWPLDRIGAVSMVGGGLVAILASLAGGVIVTALGRRLALVVFGLVQVAAVAALLPLAQGPVGTLTGLAAVASFNLAFAMAGTAISTVNMDWCRPSSAGSDYTVQDSFVHLLMQVAGSAGLALADAVGYAALLAGSMVLGLAGVGVAAWGFREPSAPRPRQADPASFPAATPAEVDP
jgi:predicted MFS family arabinose efflux permease